VVQNHAGRGDEVGGWPKALDVPGSSRERSEQECLELLHLLRDALFPQGVASARAADDSMLGLRTQEAALVLGEGWKPVQSWQAIANSLSVEGPGSAAFVLARRPAGLGHAFAAFALPAGGSGDATRGVEVVWIDPQNTVRVGSRPPLIAPGEARAVVVTSDARIVPDALPDFRTSDSVQHGLIDPSTHHTYGAIGWEIEDRHRLSYTGDKLPKGTVLVKGNGIEIQIDLHPFKMLYDGRIVGSPYTAKKLTPPGRPRPVTVGGPIAEIVATPHRVLEDENRPGLDSGILFTERARALLSQADAVNAPVPLVSLFRESDGWSVTPAGLRVTVHPAVDPEGSLAYSQYTVGVPLGGGSNFLDFAEQNISEGASWKLVFAHGARRFGTRVAALYLSAITEREIGVRHVPSLMTVPGVSEVHFYSRLVFEHAVATPLKQHILTEYFVKNLLWAGARTPFSDIYSGLRPDAREVLDRKHDQIVVQLEAEMRATLAEFVSQGHPVVSGDLRQIMQDKTWSGLPVSEFATAALRGVTSSGTQVSQNELVGMDDYYDLDTNGGRLPVGLVLLEVRDFRLLDATPRDIRRNLADMVSVAASSYDQAKYLASVRFDRRSAVSTIMANPLIRQISPVLERMALTEPPLLSETAYDRINRSLGEFALGAPFPGWVLEKFDSMMTTLGSVPSTSQSGSGSADASQLELARSVQQARDLLLRASGPSDSGASGPDESRRNDNGGATRHRGQDARRGTRPGNQHSRADSVRSSTTARQRGESSTRNRTEHLNVPRGSDAWASALRVLHPSLPDLVDYTPGSPFNRALAALKESGLPSSPENRNSVAFVGQQLNLYARSIPGALHSQTRDQRPGTSSSGSHQPYIGMALTQEDPSIASETRKALVQKLLTTPDPIQFRRIAATLHTHSSSPLGDGKKPVEQAEAVPFTDAADLDAVSTYFTHHLQNQRTPESVQAPSGLVNSRADQTETHQSTSLKGLDKPIGTVSSSPADSLRNVMGSLPTPGRSRVPGGAAAENVDEAATRTEGPDGGSPVQVGGSDLAAGVRVPVTGPALETDDPWLKAWAASRNWTTDFALTRYAEASGLVGRALGYRMVIGQDNQVSGAPAHAELLGSLADLPPGGGFTQMWRVDVAPKTLANWKALSAGALINRAFAGQWLPGALGPWKPDAVKRGEAAPAPGEVSASWRTVPGQGSGVLPTGTDGDGRAVASAGDRVSEAAGAGTGSIPPAASQSLTPVSADLGDERGVALPAELVERLNNVLLAGKDLKKQLPIDSRLKIELALNPDRRVRAGDLGLSQESLEKLFLSTDVDKKLASDLLAYRAQRASGPGSPGSGVGRGAGSGSGGIPDPVSARAAAGGVEGRPAGRHQEPAGLSLADGGGQHGGSVPVTADGVKGVRAESSVAGFSPDHLADAFATQQRVDPASPAIGSDTETPDRSAEDLPQWLVAEAAKVYQRVRPADVRIFDDRQESHAASEQYRADLLDIARSGRLAAEQHSSDLSQPAPPTNDAAHSAIQAALVERASQIAAAHEAAIGVTGSDADRARYQELTTDPRFQADLLAHITTTLNKEPGGPHTRPEPDEIVTAWRRLTAQQRLLPPSQLAQRIAPVIAALHGSQTWSGGDTVSAAGPSIHSGTPARAVQRVQTGDQSAAASGRSSKAPAHGNQNQGAGTAHVDIASVRQTPERTEFRTHARSGLPGGVNLDMVHEFDRSFIIERKFSTRLWRFSHRPPEDVLVNGFVTDNPDSRATIYAWVTEGQKESGKGVKAPFISTTRDPELWFDDRRYRYAIDVTKNADTTGIDMMATLRHELDSSHLPNKFRDSVDVMAEEKEVAFTGRIDPAAIISVYDMHKNRSGVYDEASNRIKWTSGPMPWDSDDISDDEASEHTSEYGSDTEGGAPVGHPVVDPQALERWINTLNSSDFAFRSLPADDTRVVAETARSIVSEHHPQPMDRTVAPGTPQGDYLTLYNKMVAHIAMTISAQGPDKARAESQRLRDELGTHTTHPQTFVGMALTDSRDAGALNRQLLVERLLSHPQTPESFQRIANAVRSHATEQPSPGDGPSTQNGSSPAAAATPTNEHYPNDHEDADTTRPDVNPPATTSDAPRRPDTHSDGASLKQPSTDDAASALSVKSPGTSVEPVASSSALRRHPDAGRPSGGGPSRSAGSVPDGRQGSMTRREVEEMPLTGWFAMESDGTMSVALPVPGPQDKAVAAVLGDKRLRSASEPELASLLAAARERFAGSSASHNAHNRESLKKDLELVRVLKPVGKWFSMSEGLVGRFVAVVRHAQDTFGLSGPELSAVLADAPWGFTEDNPLEGTELREVLDRAYDSLTHSQNMVPGGRDLEIARILLQSVRPQRTEKKSVTGREEKDDIVGGLTTSTTEIQQLTAEISQIKRAAEAAELAGAAESASLWTLRQQVASRERELATLRAMQTRNLSGLTHAQVAALVVVERLGQQVAQHARKALIEKLRSGVWSWAERYPLDDASIATLLADVHKFMRSRMNVTVNMQLGSKVDGRPLLEHLLADPAVLIRTRWDVSPSSHKHFRKRGAAEERLGYTAMLRRRVGSASRPAIPSFNPRPEDRSLLPKYGALTSPLRPQGATQYGNAIFHLKQEIRDRVTHTPYDSMAGSELSGAAGVTGSDHLFPLLVHGREEAVRLAFAEATKFAYDPQFRSSLVEGRFPADASDEALSRAYFETQIHGNVSWEDVERVVLLHDNSDYEMSVRHQGEIQRFAVEHKLSFKVDLLSRNPFEAFPPRLRLTSVLEEEGGRQSSLEGERDLGEVSQGEARVRSVLGPGEGAPVAHSADSVRSPAGSETAPGGRGVST
jgi:hypothetical protein